MSSAWLTHDFLGFKFKSRYQCGGKIFFKLVSPSARAVLKDGNEDAFAAAVKMVVQHWAGYGRKAEYQNTVPGTWV